MVTFMLAATSMVEVCIPEHIESNVPDDNTKLVMNESMTSIYVPDCYVCTLYCSELFTYFEKKYEQFILD